jgi:ketosteroid isomerase-like protein
MAMGAAAFSSVFTGGPAYPERMILIATGDLAGVAWNLAIGLVPEEVDMADLKELADKGIAAFNAHDAAALVDLDSEDVVFTAPGLSGRVEIRGRDANREYNQVWFDAFPDAKTTIVNECIAEDCIVQEVMFEGTHTGIFKTPMGDIEPTGKSTKGQYCLVSRVRDGKFISGSLYFDQAQLMVDLGLMPAPAAAGA